MFGFYFASRGESAKYGRMQISVILAHPTSGSFNHAIADTVVKTLSANHHQVCFHDLYAEKFDPVMPLEELIKGSPVPPAIQNVS